MRFFRPLLFVAFLGVPATALALQGPESSIKVIEPATPRLTKVKHVEPVYPEQARQARIQGTVGVQITVGTDGRVSNARLGPTIPMLGQAALDAVKQWTYDPATIETPVTLNVYMRFSVATDAPAVGSPAAGGSAARGDQGAPTTPLTTPHGFTVDVPADWQRYESGGHYIAQSRDGLELLDIAVDESGTLLKSLPSLKASFQSISQNPVDILFRKPDSPSSFYIIYVREGDRVAAILCREAKGKEGGTSGCLTMVKTSRFARSSPASDTATQPAVPSAPSAPPRPAQTGAAAPRPAPVPAPAAPPPAPTGRGIAGCWVYNTINLTIFEDGRITGFLDGGKWSRIGNDRFLFTGPPSTDTLVLSDDGGTLSGSNNYFGPLSAQRSSGSARSVVGAWKWPNGAMTVLSERGEAQNGALSGKWAREHGNAIRIVWNFFFTDDVTLSPDGQSLSGKNMQGTPVGGRRVPCST